VSSARTVGVIGIVVGALGVIVALVALTRRPLGGGAPTPPAAPAIGPAPE
jgi:hypothetical protein